MRKNLIALAVALSMLGMAGCSSDQSGKQDASDNKTNETQKTDQNSSKTDADSASDKSDSQSDQNSENSSSGTDSSTEKSDNSDSGSSSEEAGTSNENAQQNTGTSSGDSSAQDNGTASVSGSQNQTDQGSSVQNTQELMASEISSKLVQAFNESGYSTTQTEFETSDTGNEIAFFEATVEEMPVDVYVTSAANADMAQRTFDANCEADEANGMDVMNDWENNGNTVYVIRNNMANGNFVEVLDTKQSTAIHIIDQLPEQLDPVLNVLNAVSYPVQ